MQIKYHILKCSVSDLSYYNYKQSDTKYTQQSSCLYSLAADRKPLENIYRPELLRLGIIPNMFPTPQLPQR